MKKSSIEPDSDKMSRSLLATENYRDVAPLGSAPNQLPVPEPGANNHATEFAGVLVDETAAARRCLRNAVAQQAEMMFSQPRDDAAVLQSAYYTSLHTGTSAYRVNNWLLPYASSIIALQPRSVLEVGCGNGLATRKLAAGVPHVYALDWVRSPELVQLPDNVTFMQADVRTVDLPVVDVIASADVIEHFPPKQLLPLIEKLVSSGRYGLHVIACYDDGHSHLSIARPAHWLALFQAVARDYRLVNIERRRGSDQQLVCTITNF